MHWTVKTYFKRWTKTPWQFLPGAKLQVVNLWLLRPTWAILWGLQAKGFWYRSVTMSDIFSYSSWNWETSAHGINVSLDRKDGTDKVQHESSFPQHTPVLASPCHSLNLASGGSFSWFLLRFGIHSHLIVLQIVNTGYNPRHDGRSFLTHTHILLWRVWPLPEVHQLRVPAMSCSG